MRRLMSLIFIFQILVLLASCVTVPAKAIKPGNSLAAETGYIALYFMNKIELINFGGRDVYIFIRKIDTDSRIYVPFGAKGELRLIAVPPGDYRIEDFVYIVGINSEDMVDAAQEKPEVVLRTPLRSGTMLVKAKYPENYCRDITVNAGDIVYIGDYNWESKITFGESAVTIGRSFKSDANVYYEVQQRNPGMPESMKVVSIPQE